MAARNCCSPLVRADLQFFLSRVAEWNQLRQMAPTNCWTWNPMRIRIEGAQTRIAEIVVRTLWMKGSRHGTHFPDPPR